MAIEVPKNEYISGENSIGGKRVGSAIGRRRANRGSINVKDREHLVSCLVRC